MLYIIKKGEFKLEVVQDEEKPPFTEVQLEQIYQAPLQANFHNSSHNIKNRAKVQRNIHLGYQGENNTLGLFEAVQKLDNYRYSAQCTSPEAELLGVKIVDLHQKLKSNISVLEDLKNLVLNMTEQLAGKIKTKDKVTKQLEKRLQSAVTPDPSQEVPIQDRLKQLEKKYKKRIQNKQTDETMRDSEYLTSQRDTVANEFTMRTTTRTNNFQTQGSGTFS